MLVVSPLRLPRFGFFRTWDRHRTNRSVVALEEDLDAFTSPQLWVGCSVLPEQHRLHLAQGVRVRLLLLLPLGDVVGETVDLERHAARQALLAVLAVPPLRGLAVLHAPDVRLPLDGDREVVIGGEKRLQLLPRTLREQLEDAGVDQVLAELPHLALAHRDHLGLRLRRELVAAADGHEAGDLPENLLVRRHVRITFPDRIGPLFYHQRWHVPIWERTRYCHRFPAVPGASPEYYVPLIQYGVLSGINISYATTVGYFCA